MSPPLESKLIEVFILRNLNLFRINTYEKHEGWGVIANYASDEDAYPERAQRVEGPLLASDQGCLSRATIGCEGSLLESDEDSRPEEHRDGRPVPTWSGRFRPCRKGSLFTSQFRPPLSPLTTCHHIPPAAPLSP